VSGAERQTTLMIGDNLQTDIVGASNAGIETILFNRWNVEPSPVPTYTVMTLREIMQIL
jgi:putative hydrolase of the HAD superfamily